MIARADQVAAVAGGSAPADEQLVTARELVAELAHLGAGHWTQDAVRQWTREEPPCPIAAVGVQGQPHRYRVLDVLDWLLARAKREKPKAYSRADGVTATSRLDEARRKLLAESPLIFAAPGASAPEGRGGATVSESARQDPDTLALARELGVTPRHVARALGSLELVLNRYRDPRSWKAHEEARLARMKADELDGKLVPVEEVDRLLDDLVTPVRSALLAMPADLSRTIEACLTDETRRAAIQAHVDGLLQRLANNRAAEPAPVTAP